MFWIIDFSVRKVRIKKDVVNLNYEPTPPSSTFGGIQRPYQKNKKRFTWINALAQQHCYKYSGATHLEFIT